MFRAPGQALIASAPAEPNMAVKMARLPLEKTVQTFQTDRVPKKGFSPRHRAFNAVALAGRFWRGHLQ